MLAAQTVQFTVKNSNETYQVNTKWKVLAKHRSLGQTIVYIKLNVKIATFVSNTYIFWVIHNPSVTEPSNATYAIWLPTWRVTLFNFLTYFQWYFSKKLYDAVNVGCICDVRETTDRMDCERRQGKRGGSKTWCSGKMTKYSL